MNKILLICDGSTPRVLSITPALAILKRNFPKAFITVLAPQERADIFANNPSVSEIIHYKPFLPLLKQIKEAKFDLSIIFSDSPKMALLTMLAGIKKRIAPSHFISDSFINNPVKIDMPQSTPLHQKQIELLAPLFIFKIPMAPKLFVGKKDNDWAQKYLQNINILPNDKFICINPATTVAALNWPKENFAALIDKIGMLYPDFKILLICHKKQEVNAAQEIYWRAIRKPFILREPLSLANLISIINRASAVISNYSSPSHIAAALGKPVIAFYPNIDDDNFLKPQGQGVTVLQPPKELVCLKNNYCLDAISVGQALEAFNKFAKQIEGRSKKIFKDDKDYFFGSAE